MVRATGNIPMILYTRCLSTWRGERWRIMYHRQPARHSSAKSGLACGTTIKHQSLNTSSFFLLPFLSSPKNNKCGCCHPHLLSLRAFVLIWVEPAACLQSSDSIRTEHQKGLPGVMTPPSNFLPTAIVPTRIPETFVSAATLWICAAIWSTTVLPLAEVVP